MEIAHRKIERTFLRLILGSLAGFILFVILCWGGCHIYENFASRHLARRAAGYLAGGNLRDALLSARQAMQLKESAPAMRILAEISELANDRAALEWRHKVLDLEPQSTADRLALASCALQFDEIHEAEKTLALVPSNEIKTAQFEAVGARLAEAKNDLDRAEQHWTRAVQLEPQNATYSLRLGLAKLKSEKESTREDGRILLERLRADERQRAAAARALIADAVAHHQDPQKVRTLARELQNYPEAVFTDRVMYLEILRQLHDQEFAPYLSQVENDAVSKPADLAALFTWMNANQLSLVAIDFAKSVPESILRAWPVPWAMAESYTRVSDWLALEKLTRDGNWGQFDFLRRAFLARTLRAQNKSAAAEREWSGAAKAAAAQHQSLTLLGRIISEWGWKNEHVDLLWQLVKYPESQKDALQTLYQYYAKDQDTQGLYRVLLRMTEVEPSDLRVQNNLVQISLLLHADVNRARQLAAELFRKDSANAAFVSTYAFSLYEKNDFQGALKVMNGLREDQLKEPPIAAYYGVILVAAGLRDKAREYLEIGRKAYLLPEEKELMGRAEANTK